MHARSASSAGLWKLAALAALAMIVILTGGCYKRVVGVKGPGTEAYDVYEPNLKTRENTQPKKVHTVPTQTVPTQTAKD